MRVVVIVCRYMCVVCCDVRSCVRVCVYVCDVVRTLYIVCVCVYAGECEQIVSDD